MTTTPTQRISDLEAEAFRTERRFGHIGASLEHLTHAAGDLSQGQRALRLDVTELRTDVTELRTDLTQLRTDVTEVRTDLTQLRTDLTEVRTTVDRIEGEHGELLRAILAELSGKADSERPSH